MLLRRVAAGPSTVFVLGIGAGHVFVATAVMLQVLARLLDLGEGAALALTRRRHRASGGERPVVLLQAVSASVVLRRRRQLVFGFGLRMARRPALPLLHFGELPLPRAQITADLGLLVTGRAGAVVLQVPGQVVKVRGWFVAIRRAAEALGAAQLGAGPGRGGVWSLCTALFAGLLVGPRDALQSFGAAEPEMGQKRELKLEPLAAVWTRVVG